MNQITLTSLKLDGNSVEIPTGLSELLSNTWTAESKPTKYIQQYDRKVSKKDGRFVTVLTKKEVK